MKKILKIVCIVLVVGLIAIQFFRPSFSNPPIVPGQPIEDSANVTAEVQMVLARSCNDCHSNKSVYPWYAQVSPFSWFLADHISEGRRELNFSEWNTYTNEKKARKFDEICEMVESKAMPLESYLWLHRDAGLSGSQRQMLCSWAKEEGQKLAVD